MKHLELRRAGMVPALLLGMTGAALLAGCNNGNSGGTIPGSGSGSDVLATVGSTDITRDQLRNYLEGSQGEQALRALISERLLEQSLKSKGGEVTAEQVDAFLKDQQKTLEKQEAMLPAANRTGTKQIQGIIDRGGPRLASIKDNIRNQLTNYELLTRDIKVTDTQLKAWFEKNRANYDIPAEFHWGLLRTSTKVRADTMLSQLKSGSRKFKDLVTEQSKVADPYATQSFYDKTYSPSMVDPQLPKIIDALKPSAISNVLTVAVGVPGGKPFYEIVTLIKKVPGQKADFNELKSSLERAYKLQEVAKTLPPAPDQNSNPLSIKQQEILKDLQHVGNVSIKDPTYAPLADDYKPAASTSGAGGNTVTGGTTNSTTTGNAAG